MGYRSRKIVPGMTRNMICLYIQKQDRGGALKAPKNKMQRDTKNSVTKKNKTKQYINNTLKEN